MSRESRLRWSHRSHSDRSSRWVGAIVVVLLVIGVGSAVRAGRDHTSVGLENVPCTVVRTDGSCLYKDGGGACIGGMFYVDHGQPRDPTDPMTSPGYYRAGLDVMDLYKSKTYTDSTGAYASPRLQAGTYTVRCDPSKYRGQPVGVTSHTVTVGAPGDTSAVYSGYDFHTESAPVSPTIRYETVTFGADPIGLATDTLVINGQLAAACYGVLEKSALVYRTDGGTPAIGGGRPLAVGQQLALTSGSEAMRFKGVAAVEGAAPVIHFTCGTVFSKPVMDRLRANNLRANAQPHELPR